ncbi:MAG: LuxR C-terminal-related transcriptional regulator [Thermomicrobiales bacterium]
MEDDLEERFPGIADKVTGPTRMPRSAGITARNGRDRSPRSGLDQSRRIADQLYITRRTATTHVSNILNKLGLDSAPPSSLVSCEGWRRGDSPAWNHR